MDRMLDIDFSKMQGDFTGGGLVKGFQNRSTVRISTC